MTLNATPRSLTNAKVPSIYTPCQGGFHSCVWRAIVADGSLVLRVNFLHIRSTINRCSEFSFFLRLNTLWILTFRGGSLLHASRLCPQIDLKTDSSTAEFLFVRGKFEKCPFANYIYRWSLASGNSIVRGELRKNARDHRELLFHVDGGGGIGGGR